MIKSKLMFRSVLAGAVLYAAPALLSTAGIVSSEGSWVGASVYAAEEKKDPPRGRRTPTLREKVFKALQESQRIIEEEKDTTAALAVLDELKEKTVPGVRNPLNGYETAMLWNYYASIYAQMDDFRNAKIAFQNILKASYVPDGLRLSTLYALGQLSMADEEWRPAIKYFDDWFAAAINPSPDSFMLKAQCYAQLNEFKNGIVSAEDGISQATKQNKVIKEQWLNILRYLYYSDSNTPKVVEVLEQLVTMYPKKEYWLQLSGMYGEQDKTDDQLYTLEMAKVQGMLTKQQELLNLAYMRMEDLPFWSASIVKAGLDSDLIENSSKNLEFLSNAYMQAREYDKAIPPLLEAASLADSGKLYVRLGRLYAADDKWRKAVEAYQKGLRKGIRTKKGSTDTKKIAETNLAMGQALFELKRYAEAITAFGKARQHRAFKAQAKQWVDYAKNTQNRERQLAKSAG